jgi:serine protease Do
MIVVRAAVLISVVVFGVPTTVARAEDDPRAARRSPIVKVVEQVRDSVVNISATGIVQRQRRDPLFDLFFVPEYRPRVTNSVGSGFVMHEAGYIVTNAHVVDRSIDLRVTFADGSDYEATVLVSDPAHDLAVLRINPDRPLKPIPMGRSDDLMPGETVIAIGNPLGYATTITSGIISALHRRIEAGAGTAYEDVIQTDASINPGSSGGPLLNILGELVGINTAIRPGAENIGFAIPVDQLRALLPDMLEFAIAEGRHIELGLRIEGVEKPRVVEVVAGSTADQAGIRVGDELVRVDAKPVARDVDFYIAMLGRTVGDQVQMELRRADKTRQVSLTLAETPPPDGATLARQKFGLQVEELSAEAAKLFGERTTGVFIAAVERRSPAHRADCRPADLLVRIGRHRVTSVDDLGQLLEGIQPDTPVDLTLWRIIRGDVWEFRGVRVYSR